MQCSQSFLVRDTLGIFPYPVIHSYPFFNTYNIITIMITAKCCSRKMQQTTTTFVPQKCISQHLVWAAIEFHKHFNAMFDFANVWPTSKFVVECLTVLIFYYARISFDFVPPFWCELELKNHHSWKFEKMFERYRQLRLLSKQILCQSYFKF